MKREKWNDSIASGPCPTLSSRVAFSDTQAQKRFACSLAFELFLVHSRSDIGLGQQSADEKN